uniref:Carboxylic ester hydrolase n=1 Tax=Panagrolaimus sp. PS1159 TaxID=55785 RepID=A0AC35FL75_9BILA
MGAVKSRIWSPHWTESREIQISTGKLRGKRYNFVKGNVDAFLGIPYAKMNELRFQKPVPADSWNDVKDCTQFGPRCPHDEMWIERFPSVALKHEDCLRLNVFAPEWNPSNTGQPDGFAVMVFIHGGGFAVHSAAHYGDYGICEALCVKDVVVVTIQYRLGFFGFSAGEDIPSNLGLWDQTLALKWVKENINAFGGNPNNVTVFGQSAGGASADLLSISPHSRDLFQKVVPMGGTGCCSFAFNDKEHVSNICLNYAIKLGYKLPEKVKEEGNVILYKTPFEFLRTLPAHKLQIGIIGKRDAKVNQNGKLDLTPIYDGDFFPKPIDELRKEAPKKHIMTGITEHEGLLFIGLKPPRTNIHDEIPKLLERELLHHGIKDIEYAKEVMMKMYLYGLDINNKKDAIKIAVKIVSDVFINNGVWKYADTMTKLGHTVYQYCFEYYNPNNFGLLGYVLPFKAATHGTELPYLFKKGVISYFHPSEDDLKVLDIFTTYFTNFAKYGNPNGNGDVPQIWKPLTPEDTLKYMCINLDKVRMCDNLNDGRNKQWATFFEKNLGNGITYIADDKIEKEDIISGKL